MFLLLNKNLLTNLVKTYVVGVGLVKVYKALIRRALSVPFPMSMSEAFSVLFHFNKTLLHTHTHKSYLGGKEVADIEVDYFHPRMDQYFTLYLNIKSFLSFLYSGIGLER